MGRDCRHSGMLADGIKGAILVDSSVHWCIPKTRQTVMTISLLAAVKLDTDNQDIDTKIYKNHLYFARQIRAIKNKVDRLR